MDCVYLLLHTFVLFGLFYLFIYRYYCILHLSVHVFGFCYARDSWRWMNAHFYSSLLSTDDLSQISYQALVEGLEQVHSYLTLVISLIFILFFLILTFFILFYHVIYLFFLSYFV